MKLIAHRGFAGEAPENTVGAMRYAVERGADAVEFDVRRCGSGEPVVVHDATVDRVTGASGRVEAMTAGELSELDVLGSGEVIPTLAAVLDALPPAVEVNVELKEHVVDGALGPLLAAPNDGLVSSFDPEILSAVRDRDPGVDTALLCVPGDDPVERATELGCAAVHPELDLALESGFVERAHRADLSVNAWTATDRSTADDLRGAGVDGVIADYPDVL